MKRAGQPLTDGTPRKAGFGRRILRWSLWSVVGVFLLAAVLLLAAPSILSMGFARRLALGKANAALAPAKVVVADWSFAWFGGQRVLGLVYEDARQGVKVSLPEANFGSLWAMLPFGEMAVDLSLKEPLIAFSEPLPPETPSAVRPVAPTLPSSRPGALPRPGTPAQTATAEPEPFALPDWNLSLNLAVSGLKVEHYAVPEPLVADGNLSVEMAALDAPIRVAAAAKVLDGSLSAEADLPSAQALVAAKQPDDFLQLAKASFEAPWLGVSAEAAHSGAGSLPKGNFSIAAPLPELQERVAALLAPGETGVSVPSGRMTLTGTFAPDAGGAGGAVTLDLASENVSIVAEGMRFDVSPSLTLAATLSDLAAPLTATLDRFALAFPGLQASGNGSLAGGSLTAQLESEPLLVLCRPFLGEKAPSLPPLFVRVEADATPERLLGTLSATVGGEALAHLSLAAEGFNLEAQSVASLQLSATAALAHLKDFIDLPELKKLSGTASATVEGGGSPETAQAKVSLALRNLSAEVPPWKIQEVDMLQLACALEWKNRRLGVRDLAVKTPAGSLSGSASYALDAPLAQAVEAAIEADLQPGVPFSRWRVWGAEETPLSLGGAVALQLEVSPNAHGSLPLVSATVSSKGFTFAQGGKSVSAPFSLAAKGVDLGARSAESVKVSAAVALEKLKGFIPLQEGQRLAGTAVVAAEVGGSPEQAQGKIVLALRDMAADLPPWKIQEAEMLRLACAIDWKERRLGVRDLAVKTPAGSLSGSASYALDAPLAQAVEAAIEADLQPGVPFSRWRVWGAEETPLALGGAVSLHMAAAPSETGEFPAFRATASSKDFSYEQGEQRLALPWSLSAAAHDAENGWALDALAFDSAPLAAAMSGFFDMAKQVVRLEGTLTPDFAALCALPQLVALKEQGVALEGRYERPFAFEAPLGDGTDEILKRGRATAEIAFDRVTAPGLDIPTGRFAATLGEGTVMVDGEMALNGGTLSLCPRIAVGEEPFVVTFPEGTYLLKGVGLTQELLDYGLKYINPLLPGSASPAGTLDLRCDALSLKLDGQPLATLNARLAFMTHAISLMPNATLGSILALFHLRDKAVALADQSFAVTVENGALVCEDVHLNVAALKLACSGKTNLVTGELNYRIAVPLSRQLLGNRLGKYLDEGGVVSLPIGGTLDSPSLDLSGLTSALSETAIGSAVGKALGTARDGGAAAGDFVQETLDTLSDPASEAGKTLDSALQKLLNRKKKNK